MRASTWALVLVGVTAWGCTEAAPAAITAAARPPSDALCEHGVRAAVCPKCNPKLAPIFQAKKDWCDEHGFPESFCPICHPERGGRPVTDVASDGAPPDGTKIRLKDQEVSRMAGIRTATAVSQPGGARLSAPATIRYDATRVAEINARVPGVVRSLAVDLGARVERGATLATIESAEAGADQSRLQAAMSRVRLADATHARERDLVQRSLSPKKDLLQAEEELASARADLDSARAALGMLGGKAGSDGRYSLTSPLTGVVVDRSVTLGRMVDAQSPLFVVADTSKVWVEIDVPEREVTAVRNGQSVTVLLDGIEDHAFTGKVEYIAPVIDPSTRTAKARASLDNPEGLLRVNMYGRAEISLGAARETVMVPKEAVQRAKGIALVFVWIDDALFEARRVKTGIVEKDQIEIVRGVKAGERVVTQGSFLLKTETLKGSIGAGCCAGE